MLKLWINHPGVDNPVSLIRWIKLHLSSVLYSWAYSLEYTALHPDWRDRDVPF